mgnify:FL=1
MSDFRLPHDHGDQSAALRMCEELKNTAHFAAASDLFRQLSDPTRVRIFWLLSHQEECVINIAAMLDMTSPAVSHHLRSLTESKLLTSRRVGKEVYYRASDTVQMRLLHEVVEQVMQIACPEKVTDLQASQEEIIRRVHAYLVEHLAQRITIDELARIFLMNTTTLKREFKRVYGMSIAAHMKQHRMEQAAILLKGGQTDIASVARAVGYESQSRFTAAFKEAYACLPTEFRQK